MASDAAAVAGKANPVVKRKATDSLRFADSDEEEESKDVTDEKRVKTTIDTDAFKCSICLNIWHDVVSVSPCQHNFCNACFSEWYQRSTGRGGCKCPQCRGEIMFACKNHSMAALVEDLLENNPSLKRTQEEIEKMDKTSLVKGTFLKLGDPTPAPALPARPFIPAPGYTYPYRPVNSVPYGGGVVRAVSRPGLLGSVRAPAVDENENEEEEEEEEEDEEDREHEEEEEDEEPTADDEAFINDGDENEEVTCRQCSANSSAFRCQPGASHLDCASCGCDMPERTDIDVPQRCAACALACCDAYWRSQNLPSSSGEAGCPEGRLQPMSERQMGQLPLGTHKGNSVEQEFTKQYLAQRGLAIEVVVREWMGKVDRSECSLPNMHITSTSAICNHCAEKVVELLLDKLRMSVPKTDLPPEAAGRADCWYGHACRTQTHNINHAKKLNHMCEPTHRNVRL